MSYNYNEIELVHIELTNKCNALCPMCARSLFGAKINPNLDMKELSLEDVQKIFPVNFIKQLKAILFNGNYGDPALAKDIFKILSWIESLNENIVFRFHTNGGIHSPKWWRNLAKFFNKGHSEVHFGIDGLEDTNHLYRTGVQWERLMANAEAFIDEGGQAVWSFIGFRHNEHQINRAKELSEEMKFRNFIYKKTGRFSIQNVDGKNIKAQAVYDRKLNFSHFLEPALDEDGLEPKSQLTEEDNDLDGYAESLRKKKFKFPYEGKRNFERVYIGNIGEGEIFNKEDIECRVKKEKSIFINHEGQLFPCCWTSWPYHAYWHDYGSREIKKLIIQTGGSSKINAKKYPLKEIFEGEMFQTIINGVTPGCKGNPLNACGRTCKNFAESIEDVYSLA